MNAPPASSTGQSRQSRRHRQPTNGYLFVVSGLAAFLLALILGLGFRPRDPVNAVVAPAKGAPQSADAHRSAVALTQLEAIAGSLQTEATVQQTLELISKFDAAPFDRSLTAARFLRDLHISVEPAGSGRHQIVLDYRGTAPGATDILNHLANASVQLYERQFEQPARQRHFQAQQEATSAERKATVALRTYEQFIARLQPDVQKAAAPGSEATFAADRSAESADADDTPQAMIPNPAWRELSDQHQTLSRRRSELLQQMTSEHPAIRQLDVDLAQLAQTLNQTPRLIENPAAAGVAGTAPQPDPTVAASLPALPGEDQVVAETRRLRAESVAADQLVVKRQTELLASTRELESIQAGRLEVVRWAEKPALVRGSDGVTLIVAGLLAWLVGTSVASRGVPADPTITQPDVAATLLGTPVLGVLPMNEHCPRAIYPELPRSTRWVKRASEFALVALLFMAITLVIADQGFRSQLLSHPLASIPHGIDRFRELLLS